MRRHAGDKCIVRDALCSDSLRCSNDIVSNGHARKNHSIRTNPGIISNGDRAGKARRISLRPKITL